MSTRLIAYPLWLCFGWFGLHHFYLGRDLHAWLWCGSCGGFLLGWIRDFWRIGAYVDRDNEDNMYMGHLALQMQNLPKPPWSFAVILAQFLFGYYGSRIVSCLPPPLEIGAHEAELAQAWNGLYTLCSISGVALGVYLAGSTGHASSSLSQCFTGALIGELCNLLSELESSFPSLACCVFLFWRSAEWKRDKEPSKRQGGCCRRYMQLTFKVWALWAVISVALFNHGTVTIKNTDGTDDVHRIKDTMYNVYNAPVWGELWRVGQGWYGKAQREGWEEAWNAITREFDFDGENRAYAVLGLPKSDTYTPTFSQVKKAYHKLSMKLHPDKNKAPDAEKKFIELRDAYEKLTELHGKRSRKAEARAKYEQEKPKYKKKQKQRKGQGEF